MLKKYEPPYFMILASIIILNAIFSTYYISILFAGVVYKIFLIVLKKEYYYLLLFSIFTFVNIENIQGIPFFTMTVVSLVLYYLIIPKIKHIFSSIFIMEFIFLFIFYCSFLLYSSVTFSTDLFSILLINFLIDSIIIGFIL